MERNSYRHQENEPLRRFAVIKFGGSSLADAESINLCINAVRSGNYRAVVVSAPGETTNLLKEVLGNNRTLEEDGELLSIYQGFQQKLDLPDPNLIYNCIEELKCRLRSCEIDSVMAWGEWSMAQIFAAKLGGTFVDSANVLRIKEDCKGDRLIHENSLDLVKRKFENTGNILVFSGYYGSSLKDGTIMTLNRGGSDLTGVYIAYCIGSGLVKSTDVDGLLDGQGNVVPRANFCVLESLDPNAKLINLQAKNLAMGTQTAILIKNTRNTNSQGTIVS